MIKIAFVIDTILSPTGGTEKHILLQLKNIDRTRFSPYLCILRSSAWIREEFSLCPVYVLGIDSFRSLSAYARIWKFAGFLKGEGISIVHTYYRDAGIAGILAARIAGKKTIFSARRNQGYWLDRKELVLQKALNRLVARFVANSYSTKAWSNEVEGIPGEKIDVIYNCIDLQHYRRTTVQNRRESRQLLGLPDYAPVIGIVANLRPVKGIDVFLKAAKLVKDELPQARFLIVGDGEEEENLKRLSAELGLGGCADFLGRKRDVARVLNAFDVAVLSSYSESFSNSIVEYLAAGIPVVCTDVGGSREAVESGVNGFVVPAGDSRAMAGCIARIITEGMFHYMNMRNRDKAEKKFSIAGSVKAYEKLYGSAEGVAGADCSSGMAVINTKAE